MGGPNNREKGILSENANTDRPSETSDSKHDNQEEKPHERFGDQTGRKPRDRRDDVDQPTTVESRPMSREASRYRIAGKSAKATVRDTSITGVDVISKFRIYIYNLLQVNDLSKRQRYFYSNQLGYNVFYFHSLLIYGFGVQMAVDSIFFHKLSSEPQLATLSPSKVTGDNLEGDISH